jgi:outer membrane receptor protein involved in Fe transport
LLVGGVNQSSAWVQHSGSVALRYGFSPNVSAEVFYTGENSLMPSPEQYAIFDFLPPAGYTGPTGMSLLPIYCTQGTTAQNISSLLEEKITAQLGRGVVQLAALQNRTSITLGLNYLTSATVQLYGAGYLNGSSTPTIFDGGTYSVTAPTFNYYITSWSNNRDLLFSYVTPLGASFHAGVSFVKSYYDNPETTLENIPIYGIDDSTSYTPAAISQTTNEMRFFVGGNLSEKISLDLSMYVVNANYHVPDPNNIASYTTPGADVNYVDANYTYAAPRLGFVWRPTAAVAVRAAAGGGFAEAPLGDLVGSNAPSCFGAPVCAVTSPNLNLQPEKSFGFDLGTDIKLPRNTILSFDVYHTNLYGQLYESATTNGSCPTCGGAPLVVTQYGNLGESRYEGILVDLRHTVPHGTYWSLSGGLTRGYVVSVPTGFYNGTTGYPYTPCTDCANLNVVPGVNFNGTFTNGVSVPYAQGLGTLGYRWSAYKYVDLVGTYYGNNNTYFRPAFVELDGHIGYPLTRNVSLLVTFRNITGIYDGAYQIWSPGNFSGAPTISGLPYVLYGEMYGPRTVLLTSNVRL